MSGLNSANNDAMFYRVSWAGVYLLVWADHTILQIVCVVQIWLLAGIRLTNIAINYLLLLKI